MASDIDGGVARKPYAVIFGATSLVGRHLPQCLAEYGFTGLCLSRCTDPAPCETQPGFSWSTVCEQGDFRVPASATLFSFVPIAALDAPGAKGELFDLPGGETLTYRERVGRIFQSLGRRPVLLYLPLGPARIGFPVWQTITGAKYSAATQERMNMDLTLDPSPVREALGITCRPFRPEFANQVDAQRA